MCSSESWRDREQELLALEVAGARIHSSVQRNLEGNLILEGLDLVRITCFCRRDTQRPKRSRVFPGLLPTSPLFTEDPHISRENLVKAPEETWLGCVGPL